VRERQAWLVAAAVPGGSKVPRKINCAFATIAR